MYQAVTLAEEAYLRNKFGPTFDQYCERVPRWWPRLAGLKDTLREAQFNWKRTLVKEYSAPLGWVLPIVLIGIYNIHRATGLDAHPAAVATLWAILAVVATFWIIVALLKKTRASVLRPSEG